jgi:hypothetical protein
VVVMNFHVPEQEIFFLDYTGQLSGLGVGVGLTTPHHKNLTCYRMFQSALGLG